MSDNELNITAIDSLMNPEGKTREELSSLISELGLSFSTRFLVEIYKCLSDNAVSPSYELLRFFDSIFIASKKDANNVKISGLSTESEEINLSFIDACDKAAYLGKDTPLSISDILKISSEYLAALDVKAPDTVGKGNSLCVFNENGKTLVSLGLDATKPLRYGYLTESEFFRKKQKAYLPAGTDIYLVSADDENYLRLAEREEFGALRITDEVIGEKGLLWALLEMCCGVKITLCNALPSLITDLHGRRIIAVSSDNYDTLAALAEDCGVTLTNVATALALPLTRIPDTCGEIVIKTEKLRKLFSFEEKLNVNASCKQIAPTKYEKLFYGVGGGQEFCELTEAVEVNRHIVSALCTRELSFASGLNTVLDSLFALLAKGADRRKVGISIRLRMRRENLDGGVSALLGAYRSVMELCLPEINSEVAFSDEDYIVCTAFARKEDYPSYNENAEKDNRLFLLSFGRDDSSLPRYMPDFDELRSTCDLLFGAIKSGAVLSARAINGTLSEATEGMTVIYENGSISKTAVAQGFVSEVAPNKNINGLPIGVLKKENTKNDDTEETL